MTGIHQMTFTRESRDHYRKRARQLINQLKEIGFPAGSNLFRDNICIAPKRKVNLKKDDQLTFARLVRAMTCLEGTGAIATDIDRMGKLVGWHITQEQ